jgi:hypothetical protein
LELSEVTAEVSDRLGRSRIGYGCHKEWVFQPLVRWFEMLRKQDPSLWRTFGVQLLDLDQIAEQQGADNRYSDELHAQVGAAAMACGPTEFESLFRLLVDRDTKHPLWSLAKVAQDGFEICLRECHDTNEDSLLARAAVAIAVGRWPGESPLSTLTALLTAKGVPPDTKKQPTWLRAVQTAADIQGLPATINASESAPTVADNYNETRTAETILAQILQPSDSSWLRLQQIAALSEQAKAENHPNREDLIASAIGRLECSEAFARCIEFHDFSLMSRLYINLTESERWRLLAAITFVTGDIRQELSDANWAFMVAGSAVNLACRARVEESGHEFALAIFEQLLAMHWKWHGITPSQRSLTTVRTPSTWVDSGRRMLLALTSTDGCEPLYMAMCGLRFFAELFPTQIPMICSEGIGDEYGTDAVLPLAQLWATRRPAEIASVLPEIKAYETTGTLDDRLDAWAVGALHRIATSKRPQTFPLPEKTVVPEITFPGDTQLFEADVDHNGLIRHNSFARMANERLRRVGLVLGSMQTAFRHLVRTVRESDQEMPSLYMRSPKRLAFDQDYPRPRKQMENLVGDAILHQCAGEKWSPDKAGAVRQLIGYGMDPWVASSPPNAWQDKKSWPSGSEVEAWVASGASSDADVAKKLLALLEGFDLGPDLIVLGAMLRLPTYMRDLELRYWLMMTDEDLTLFQKTCPSTPAGRSLASWLGGWSFCANMPAGVTSVQFAGCLVSYPNADLDVTPTDQWIRDWGWIPDSKHALRFRTPDNIIAAWHEHWLGPETNYRKSFRQPLLSRWVAKRACIPSCLNELKNSHSRTDMSSRLLSQPE